VARPGSEAGFSLVALLAAVTILLIVVSAGGPFWKYIMKDMREEELYFRGDQIASAIERFQKKNGGALPTSLEVLVKGKFLRKQYAEPFAKDGKWRYLRQGELTQVALPGGARPGGSLGGGTTGPTFAPAGQPNPSAPPQVVGPFMGVASISKDKSLRLMNGRDSYDQWLFVAGQPRVLGRQETAIKGGLPGQGGIPGLGGGTLGGTPTPAPPTKR
jgi:type II secretory pathway pseudopilin PulG